MQWVATLAVPFCALAAACGGEGGSAPMPHIRVGQCLDLLPHLPIGGESVTGPGDGSPLVFPCGAADLAPETARRDAR